MKQDACLKRIREYSDDTNKETYDRNFKAYLNVSDISKIFCTSDAEEYEFLNFSNKCSKLNFGK